MGCIASMGPYSRIYGENRQVAAWKRDYDTLRLTEPEVGKIYQNFVYVDSDKSGSVDIAELLVNCKLGEDELVMFAYELYDMDGSGTMDKIEVQQILEDVYGKQFATNPMAKALVTSVHSLPDKVTVEDFGKFCHEHVLLLFPAYEVQNALTDFFGGKRFWNAVGKRRRLISNNVYINTKKFMRMFAVGVSEGELEKQWQFEQDKKAAKPSGRKKYAVPQAGSQVAPAPQLPTKPDHHIIISDRDEGMNSTVRRSNSPTRDIGSDDGRNSTARRITSGPSRDRDSTSRSPRRDSTGLAPSYRREPGAPRDRRPSDIAGDGAAPSHLKKKDGEHHHHHHHKEKDAHPHPRHHTENTDAFHQQVELGQGHHGVTIKNASDGSSGRTNDS